MQSPISVPISKAAKILENLYLGEAGEYYIYFSGDQLKEIEDIFDTIIYTHGITSVYFRYIISKPEPWSGSLENRIRIEKSDVNVKKMGA